jgi:L-alanine-DL-glutamate epimerase-like enolase superfamily enzyme
VYFTFRRECRRIGLVKIASIEAIPYEIPYTTPLRFASGEVTLADNVLVRITTDEGIVGHAEAVARPYTYGESQTSIRAAILDWFGPALIGTDPFARERVQAVLQRTVGNNTARAAIDIALWDILGRALDQPCHMLLGGYAPAMRVAHMVGFGTPEEAVEDALGVRERFGITAFKVKVGRSPWSIDVDTVRALRDALGPDAELYLDANRGWTPDEATSAIRAMDGLGIAFVEEPCPVDAVLGRRRVVDQAGVTIVGDESCTRLGEVARHLIDGASTAISIKIARTGFTESTRILGLCEGLGATVFIGNQVDGMLGSLAAVTFGAAFRTTSARPGELSNFITMADDLLAEPLQITDGTLRVREQAGLGAVIDDDKLDRYRIDN